mmetsp:Transcript_18376/g.52643  ORF Transcript_18376/g.52643 Transcript_18376/m.52643 type:complete len:420 (+) Transcript_18376:502-1761(+)
MLACPGSALLEAVAELARRGRGGVQDAVQNRELFDALPEHPVRELLLEVPRHGHDGAHLLQARPLLPHVDLLTFAERLPQGLRHHGGHTILADETPQQDLLLVLLGIQVQQLRHRGRHLPHEGRERDEGNQHHDASKNPLHERDRGEVLRRWRELRQAPVECASIEVRARFLREVGQPRHCCAVVVVPEGVPATSNEVVEHEDATDEAKDADDHQGALSLDRIQQPCRHFHQPTEAQEAEEADEAQHLGDAGAARELDDADGLGNDAEDRGQEVHSHDGDVEREPGPHVDPRDPAHAHLHPRLRVEACEKVRRDVACPKSQGQPRHDQPLGHEHDQLQRDHHHIVAEQRGAEGRPAQLPPRLGVHDEASEPISGLLDLGVAIVRRAIRLRGAKGEARLDGVVLEVLPCREAFESSAAEA